MKLRRSFSSHQLLFAFGITMSFFAFTSLSDAQDKITKKDNQVQDAKIVGMTGSTVMVEVAGGKFGIPLTDISAVSMAAPAQVAAANAAFAGKDYPKALASAKAVVDQFKGLPTDWAQQMTGLIGDIYLAQEKLPEAEAAYKDFQKAYGAKGGAQTDVGLAKIALAKKDFSGAKAKLEPIVAKALGEKSSAPEIAPAYSQAFFLMGQVNEAEQDYPAALENYLRTVTIFYQDSSSVAAAQKSADALREAHHVIVP